MLDLNMRSPFYRIYHSFVRARKLQPLSLYHYSNFDRFSRAQLLYLLEFLTLYQSHCYYFVEVMLVSLAWLARASML